ncbi:uncharacterized protein UHOD_12135 [Ustilago sp. UG-2017b]|nr:uncharacterized protein UHOD_12135 [Ustilago sp. UG-2017b]
MYHCNSRALHQHLKRNNLIAVQVTTRASSSSATNTHAVSENCILYHSQVNVLRTCHIASERSVQGGQPKPTRTQPSGYSQTNISNRAYSVDPTENDWKYTIWFQARDRLHRSGQRSDGADLIRDWIQHGPARFQASS